MTTNTFNKGDSVLFKSDDVLTVESVNGDKCTCSWIYEGEKFTFEFNSEHLEKPTGNLRMQFSNEDEVIEGDLGE